MKILIYKGKSIVGNVNLSSYGKNIIGFGRSSDCDIVLNSIYVSGTHGCFSIEGDSCVVHDMESKNGIKVNGQTVKDKVLEDGDIIEVYSGGEDEVIRMEFMDEPEDSGKSSDSPKKKLPLAVKIAIPVVLVLAAVLLYAFVFKKSAGTPKGEFVAVIEGEYGTETDTITFYDGTYTLKQSIEHNDSYSDEYGNEDTSGRNEEDYIGFGTYKVKNNKIYLYDISDMEWIDEDNELDDADKIVGKYDKKHNEFTITQYGWSDYETKLNTVQNFDTSKDNSDIIFKENDKKAKTKVSIDDKYMSKLNSNIQEASEKALDSIGVDNIFSEGGQSLNVYIDKYNYESGNSDFEKELIDALKDLKDDKLDSMIEEGLIYIHVTVYYNSSDNYTITSDMTSGLYNFEYIGDIPEETGESNDLNNENTDISENDTEEEVVVTDDLKACYAKLSEIAMSVTEIGYAHYSVPDAEDPESAYWYYKYGIADIDSDGYAELIIDAECMNIMFGGTYGHYGDIYKYNADTNEMEYYNGFTNFSDIENAIVRDNGIIEIDGIYVEAYDGALKECGILPVKNPLYENDGSNTNQIIFYSNEPESGYTICVPSPFDIFDLAKITDEEYNDYISKLTSGNVIDVEYQTFNFENIAALNERNPEEYYEATGLPSYRYAPENSSLAYYRELINLYYDMAEADPGSRYDMYVSAGYQTLNYDAGGNTAGSLAMMSDLWVSDSDMFIKYSFYDVDKDGIEELIIDNCIYSYVGGNVVPICQSSFLDYFFIGEDDKIYNSAIGDNAEEFLSRYSLSDGKLTLEKRMIYENDFDNEAYYVCDFNTYDTSEMTYLSVDEGRSMYADMWQNEVEVDNITALYLWK